MAAAVFLQLENGRPRQWPKYLGSKPRENVYSSSHDRSKNSAPAAICPALHEEKYPWYIEWNVPTFGKTAICRVYSS